MTHDDFRNIVQPLNYKADGRAHQRILIKLAYALSQELNKKERLKKSGEVE